MGISYRVVKYYKRSNKIYKIRKNNNQVIFLRAGNLQNVLRCCPTSRARIWSEIRKLILGKTVRDNGKIF